ncbi:MAG: hypothetical protein NUV51_03660 [Sulfuricaulis sp.]|nr:hypothetical protein [Sulfuricaulis sp.]
MTKEERRELMPVSSAFWDDYVREFGLPAWFRAEENGQVIEFKKEKK